MALLRAPPKEMEAQEYWGTNVFIMNIQIAHLSDLLPTSEKPQTLWDKQSAQKPFLKRH